ncbi:MAG: hypothetical protein JW818_04405 [Pirellulales bacterium]|nr:hypothetical protein [Pirellulales bacterium]
MRGFLGHGSVRAIFVAVGLLGSTGCVPCIYVLPKVHYFPPADVNAPANEVTAVLVRASGQNTHSIAGYTSVDTEIVSLQVYDEGRTERHTDVTIESAAQLISALPMGWKTSHERQIRLYRPGYQLVTLKPWSPWSKPWPNGADSKKVEWIPAVTPEQQEEALDGLLADLRTTPWKSVPLFGPAPPEEDEATEMESSLRHKLATGWRARRGRALLQYVASEYVRLADQLEHAPPPGLLVSYVPQAPPAGADPRERVERLRLKSQVLNRAAQR